MRGTAGTPRSFSSTFGNQGEAVMLTISNLSPVLALIAGILILLIPRLLNLIVAIWLIAYGVIHLVR
jgi:hypothetical protein